MKKNSMYALALFALLAAACNVAAASDQQQTSIHVGVQQYDWKEFDTSGSVLDKESGPMLTIGGAFDNFRRINSGPIYDVNGQFYVGNLNYDGQTQAGVPLKTKSDYTGLQFEGLGGYRFEKHLTGLDLFGGGGWDMWSRAIKDGTTSAGTPSLGYTETYFILYARLGAGFFQELGSWSYNFRAGAKVPLYTTEYANLADGLTLSPGKKASAFARFEMEFGPSTRNHFGIILSYDSFRFSESNPELLTSGGAPVGYFVQPESHRDVYGVRGVYYFH